MLCFCLSWNRFFANNKWLLAWKSRLAKSKSGEGFDGGGIGMEGGTSSKTSSPSVSHLRSKNSMMNDEDLEELYEAEWI